MQNKQAHSHMLILTLSHIFVAKWVTHAGMRAVYALHYLIMQMRQKSLRKTRLHWTIQELHKKRKHYNLLNMLMKESAWSASRDVALFMVCSTAAAVQEWMTGKCWKLSATHILHMKYRYSHTFLTTASFLHTHIHTTLAWLNRPVPLWHGIGTNIGNYGIPRKHTHLRIV